MTIESKSIARPVFRDSSLQNEFEKNGYVVVPNFIDASQISDLNELYLKYSPDIKSGFHVTNWTKNAGYRNEAHRGVSQVISVQLAKLLLDYKPILGCFAAKEPGYENEMGLHQDWSVTDESKYFGVSAWIPLIDVDNNTGAIKMLKGSHRLFQNIRGQKIRNMLNDVSQSLIGRYLTDLPMKAGDLLILHHRIVHSSGNSALRRVAAMMALIPKEAEVQHYLASESYDLDGKIRVFNCPSDFYVNFDIESHPEFTNELESVFQTELLITDQIVSAFYGDYLGSRM